ncbi:hypothetical protein BDV12DRAFT_180733 [Aspergillus spectabilis]
MERINFNYQGGWGSWGAPSRRKGVHEDNTSDGKEECHWHYSLFVAVVTPFIWNMISPRYWRLRKVIRLLRPRSSSGLVVDVRAGKRPCFLRSLDHEVEIQEG